MTMLARALCYVIQGSRSSGGLQLQNVVLTELQI